MPPSWSDWPLEAVLHEALVAPRDAFVPIPGLRHVRRPGWDQLITPALRDGGLNEITLCAVADTEADAVIDRTLAEYAAAGGLRFRWLVGPDSRPADLAARLAARGLLGSRCVLMAARVADLAAAAAAAAATAATAAAEPAAGITVERVAADAIDAYAEVLAAGWGMAPGPVADYHAAAARDPRDIHAFFLARVDGEPAGAAGCVAFAHSVHLQGAVVLPHLRSRGVYRALIAARLAYAQARGLTLLTTQARAETSAPILERVGFARILELPTFLNR